MFIIRQVSEIAVNDLPLAVIGENGKNENAVFCHSCLERVSSDHQKVNFLLKYSILSDEFDI